MTTLATRSDYISNVLIAEILPALLDFRNPSDDFRNQAKNEG
jgi:hypothetical protein